MENYILFLITIVFSLMLKLVSKKKLESFLKLFFDSQYFKRGFLLLNLALIMFTCFYGMLVFLILLNKGNSILVSSITPLLLILATINIAYRSVLLLNE